ncbi:MAG: hypothetical protein MUC83_10740, partial [Pirellula sp.]|nr:hypothetical protein [Pirellula sp.]
MNPSHNNSLLRRNSLLRMVRIPQYLSVLIVVYFVSPSISLIPNVIANEPWIRAAALEKGDTIALVAPAGPVEIEPVKRYAKQLESAGFRVLVPSNVDRKWEYLA